MSLNFKQVYYEFILMIVGLKSILWFQNHKNFGLLKSDKKSILNT